MERIELKFFRYSKQSQILISIVIVLLLVLIFFIYSEIIELLSITSEILIGISFIATMLIFSMGNNYLQTILLYNDIGVIQIENDEIVIKYNNGDMLNFNSQTLQFISFYYAGDTMWNAKYKIFQQWKSRNRYLINNKASRYSAKYFDKIEINKLELFVKIKNNIDKSNFIKILEWTQNKGISFSYAEKDYKSLNY